MIHHAALNSVLQTDLRFFIWKCCQTISPGTPYQPNWHIDAIAHQLMRVHGGKISRLLINQPPRSLKSISVSIAYAAWLLGHDPTRRIIVVSYSNELAAELHRQFRMAIDSDWYQSLFPRMRPARDTGSELVTTAGGGRYATSVGGTLTGRGADLIIIDDPQKAEDVNSDSARRRVIEWYGGTLVSRLNNKGSGPIIVVMQRLHENDLAGHLLEQGGWEHLELPAIAYQDSIFDLGGGVTWQRRVGDVLHPERESTEALERIRKEIGFSLFSAQFQQQPIPHDGNIIKRDWFRTYRLLPVIEAKQVVQSWDIAIATGDGNDYSVCTTWIMVKQDYYLVDVFRDRLQFPALRREVISLAERYDANTILIENTGPGMALLQSLWHDLPRGMTRPIGLRPDLSKVDRMAVPSAKIEAGHVYVPMEAEWLDRFLLELLAFPNGRHDDQVDSVSQFLNWASRRNSRGIGLSLFGPKIFHG
jgi:predicted phage terminase large subunit-like protein